MKKNVLVFPCGSEIGLEINRSLKFSKDFKIFGASSVDDHGRLVYENYISDVPHVDDDNFIKEVNEIVKKHSIDFIFPAHDSVVLKLSQYRDKLNAKVVTSPHATCNICRSKSKTYEFFGNTLETPAVYDINDSFDFPVFLKPDIGQGSRGVLRASSLEEVKSYIKKDSSLLILDYLPGKEYTVDCFTNKKGELLFAQGRERIRIMNGISVDTKPVENIEFLKIAQKINEKLKFQGLWFFQIKENSNKKLALLEIAPRGAGTMEICRMQGVNLPLLSLYDQMGIDIIIIKNNFDIELDRALSAKFRIDITYKNVYVDLDDAIIFDGRVNEPLIAFLYKSINRGKRIILISKHIKDIKETLKKNRISLNIFDEIIPIGKGEEKSEHMKNNSIFIDDSFSERKKVFDKLGIPVFDVNEIVQLN